MPATPAPGRSVEDLQRLLPGCLCGLEEMLARCLAQVVPVASKVYSLGEADSFMSSDAGSLSDGRTLLMAAAAQGQLEVVEAYVAHGQTPGVPAIETCCDGGWTALTYAVVNGSAGAVQALIKGGATVNGRDAEGRTALHHAAAAGGGRWDKMIGIKVKVVELLLDAGADVNALCECDWSPLHGCCDADNSCAALLLIRAGADVLIQNGDGNTPMHLVCEENDCVHADDLLSIVCALGGDANAVNHDGKTPLHLVCSSSFENMLTLLEFYPKLNLSVQDNDGNTPLHSVPDFYENDTYEWLLCHGADFNVRNKEGNTPLHILAEDPDSVVYEDGHVSRGVLCMHELVKKGADIDIKNNEGFTALDLAVQEDNMTTIDLLRTEAERRAAVRNVAMAFAMGSHARVGQGSLVKDVYPELMRVIMGQMGEVEWE
ncbi:ankyrin repeat-containing domain protein [Baffinella frigidus]|nr:ankyrin repeat-containing domain protein [Cryptophyta sp. CCMP2293]